MSEARTAARGGSGQPPVQRIAADVGGTFTDIAIFDEASRSLLLGKTLTTPDHIVHGIGTGLEKAGGAFDQASLFLHGATIAINTLLERNGARTALVTTRGFRDIYEIGRVNRPEAYNLFFRKHVPLVERALRLEVDERITAAGEILRPLAEAELERVAGTIASERVDAIAILFLHSYRNPAHELAAKRFFEARFPRAYVTASHELSQEYREFERTSTVAANAYIGPRVKTYLGEIESHLADRRFGGTFLVVQSTGGLYDAAQAKQECIRMLESGPAAGVIGTRELCRSIGLDKAIALDMGGTTAKSGVILDGEVLMTSNSMIGGYNEGLPVQIPMIDIQEVGTGGGSIARIGPARSLRVGPQSAGSQPGPVCYGLGGTAPTVTDANLVLGRLSATRFLGGEMRLDFEGAREAIRREIADPLGLSVEQAADGIVRIAAASMSSVVKRVTTDRGLDARDFPMVAFGGAGPLHATFVARELHVKRVIVPVAPGHFSAYGMLVADLRRDFVKTLFVPLAELDFDRFETLFRALEEEGERDVRRAAGSIGAITVSRALDMRYVGQEHAVTVDVPLGAFHARDAAEVKRHFDRVHTQRYGYCSETEPAEIVSIRTSVSGAIAKPEHARIAAGDGASVAPAGRRPVYFATDGGWIDTPVHRRDLLRAGDRIEGPAVIEEYASTTICAPGEVVFVDGLGNLLIEITND
jgi:N-methylhydantoinase A